VNPPPTPEDASGPDIVADVLAAVRGTSVTDLDVEWEGGSLHLRRDAGANWPEAAEAAPAAAPAEGPAIVRSPYVGIFHREAEGGYPQPGAVVNEQTLLGEVETMGIRNAVKAALAGVLVEVLVPDRTPVEFGQALAVVRPGPQNDA
jgi:biotin carboxyl carrier protein